MRKGKRKSQNRKDVDNHSVRQQGKERKDKYEEKFTIEDLLVKVEEYMGNFNFELAEKFCNRALEMSPDNQQALNLAASVFLEMGNSEKAADCLRHAIDVEPEKDSTKYMILGQLLEGEEAAECFKKGIQLMIAEKQIYEKENSTECDLATTESSGITDREISNAFCSLAEIYLTDCCFAQNAENSCMMYCEKAVEQDPSNPDAYQAMANFMLSERKNEEAKEMLTKSLNLWQVGDDQSVKEISAYVVNVITFQGTPPSYESRISLSKMLIEVKEFDTACSVLEGLLQEDDEVVQVWYLLGWINYVSQQDSTGVKYYLENAKKLFTQTECDDKPLLEHIEELLSETDEKVSTTKESQQENDEDDRRDGVSEDRENESMDTTT